MDQLLKRVNAIAEATGNSPKKEDVTQGQDIDEFTRLKRTINLEIREIRNDIKDRDEFADSFAGKNDQPEIAKKSARIMTRIKDLRSKHSDLVNLIRQEESKLQKKNKDVKALDPRKKMADLIEAHIDECDRWSKGKSLLKQKDDPSKAMLLKGAKLGYDTTFNPNNFVPSNATETELEEVDGIDEGLMQLRENEVLVDQQLDMLVETTAKIKVIATRLGEEYRVLGGMMDEVEGKMDKTANNLEESQNQLDKLAKAVGGKQNCCFTIFLLLALVACVYFVITEFF